MMRLIHGRAEDWLAGPERAKAIWMDPPDNIGLGYDGYRDRIPDDRYYYWLYCLIRDSMKKADVVWASVHSQHLEHVASMVLGLAGGSPTAPRSGAWDFRTLVWRFTFGQYNDRDHGYGYRPIFRIVRRGTKLNMPREESERMRIGDPRAAKDESGEPRGRVPDDVWDFPRVVGNSPERRAWHPTQHPVVIYGRAINCSCPPGERFVDLFAGSGTCFRAARLAPGVEVVGIEQSAEYCARMQAENGGQLQEEGPPRAHSG